MTFSGFSEGSVETDRGALFHRSGGDGPPVLLLHGFPETHLMWRDVAPALARDFRVIAADLPGYGQSSSPPDDGGDHRAMSKRAMAADLVGAMRRLGHARFAVVGHDRGGRVAYRIALDHAESVTRLAVLDVVPTAEVWERADARLALAFWPFSLLAQPAPLPERLIGGAPEAVVEDALANWGSSAKAFPDAVRDAYVAALHDPARVHAICEEYRAAAGIDREHDAEDRARGHRIRCPLLALWSEASALDTWYSDSGGPLALWRLWCDDVRGQAVPGGHFFPEERPAATAAALRAFLAA
jgi:haloacetate dehalogenase